MKLLQLFESKKLNFELIWFQRYITDHDLETQLEIEGDKIVFRVEKKLIEWDVTEARRIRTEVMIDAEQSYLYADQVIKGRFELGESAISADSQYSYWYAKMIKSRFELGEPAIATNSQYSFLYAKGVIKRRFELGEPAISMSAHRSLVYANQVLHKRFELGEPAIAKNSQYSYWYAQDVINGRFELGEPAIAADNDLSKKYQEWLKSHP